MKQQDSGFLGDRERTPFQIGFAFLMRLLVGRGRERREELRRRGAGIGALLKSTQNRAFASMEEPNTKSACLSEDNCVCMSSCLFCQQKQSNFS